MIVIIAHENVMKGGSEIEKALDFGFERSVFQVVEGEGLNLGESLQFFFQFLINLWDVTLHEPIVIRWKEFDELIFVNVAFLLQKYVSLFYEFFINEKSGDFRTNTSKEGWIILIYKFLLFMKLLA